MAATLAAVPAARRGLPRSTGPAIALLGVVWMAAPFVLFGMAEQSIDSSLEGMLNAAAPLSPPSWLRWSRASFRAAAAGPGC
jgi:hypothetical protein